MNTDSKTNSTDDPADAHSTGTTAESQVPATAPETMQEVDSNHQITFWKQISTQLTTTFAGFLLLTVAVGLVGWISLDRVGTAQRVVNEGSVPALISAFGIARHSTALATAAPQLSSAQTQLDLTYTSFSISEARRNFNAELEKLVRLGEDYGDIDLIKNQGRALINNISSFEDLMWERSALDDALIEARTRLEALQIDVTSLLVAAIDDQFFYAMTGFHTLGKPPVKRNTEFFEREFSLSRILTETQADAVIAFEILTNVMNISHLPFLEPLRERFDATERRILQRIQQIPESELKSTLLTRFAELREFATGPDGNITLRGRQLQLLDQIQNLLDQNQEHAVTLGSRVETLVQEAQSRATDAANASEDVILTGRNLLLLFLGISVAVVIVTSWFFVGRTLLKRLAALSERMRQMAAGDLEAEVQVKGGDEIAEMSAALEIFRRNALEVQRLNLVEHMANELQAKNEEIEAALAELEKAQDQIVMREKLAALGELTAGVAHEIRNPLNFVKNFSEGSSELLDEMMEEVHMVMGEEDDDTSDNEKESRALIEEICNDLYENMRLILQHGSRADSIVQSMLQMGRGSGEPQPTDINVLVDEHTRLAYHSERAKDPDFNLELVLKLDPTVGELSVIPQDLGRVFLNLASNGCYAADDKRRKIASDGSGSRHYPELRVMTKNLGDTVEIRVRDNGNGIPPDVAEKMFNPFFTTKPTDKGTGLGLALSNDIIREHGGSITVDTEPGKYTEMIVTIPRIAPVTAAAEQDDDDSLEFDAA